MDLYDEVQINADKLKTYSELEWGRTGLLNMTTTTIKMTDVEHCLICGEYIGKGNDPALCNSKHCLEVFECEVSFNKFTKEQGNEQIHF